MKIAITILALVVLNSGLALAEDIQCHFTEPFAVTTYSSANHSLTVELAGEKTKIITNVSLQSEKTAKKFKLISADGIVLQNLELNYAGSDGMSDRIYPYAVEDFEILAQTNPAFFGGCFSK